MARPRTTPSPSENGITSLDDWKQQRFGIATLPTGRKVRLRSVTLDELAADEALPDDLVRIAVLERLPGGVAAEMARETLNGAEGIGRARKLAADTTSLLDRLVLRAVVQPPITAKDLPELDPFDKALIADLASRQTDIDIEGKRVWGVEPLSTFLVFRTAHACPDDCPECDNAVSQFSATQPA